MATYFRNPTNDYVEKATTRWTWLWALLFGPFYFLYKGIWSHAIINFIFWPLIVVWIGYAIFASDLVKKSYRQRGWIQVREAATTPIRRHA